MNDCIFCKIVAGEIPSKKAYEDDLVLAFYDIAPQAPTHILIIPKRHIESVDTVTAQDGEVLTRMFTVTAKLAHELGLSKDGYRVVSNVGTFGQQSVQHLHLHLLGGQQMSATFA